MEKEQKKCPKCGEEKSQMKSGFNRSGTQRVVCGACKYKYTANPKTRAYSDEIRAIAIKEYYAGVSGRGVGKIHGFSQHNVVRWIKKNRTDVDK